MIKTKKELALVSDPLRPDVLISKVIYGEIDNPKWINKFTAISIPYRYFYLNDLDEEVLIKGGEYLITKDQINYLSSNINIKGKLKTDAENELFHKAFVILMSQNYDVKVEDIEII